MLCGFDNTSFSMAAANDALHSAKSLFFTLNQMSRTVFAVLILLSVAGVFYRQVHEILAVVGYFYARQD